MSKSKIEWCDRVWNPVTGCARVSPGCDNCYAIRQSHRFAGVKGSKFEGVTKAGVGTTPLREGDHIDWSGKVVCHEDLLDMPLRWKKPSRVFVNSMSDLFHDDVPDKFIDNMLWRMAWCRRHVFMILTKRPLRMKIYCNNMADLDRKDRATRILVSGGVKHLPEAIYNGGLDWPLPNVWLGVSCENQAMADQRIPHLLKTPAAVRFVSYEPALGPIDFTKVPWMHGGMQAKGEVGVMADTNEPDDYVYWEKKSAIQWVICGGESGPNARPMHPDWARSVRDQCKAAGVPFFFKQWGEWAPWQISHAGLQNVREVTYIGANGEFSSESRGRLGSMVRVGKTAAGRLLDGVEYSEWPEAGRLRQRIESGTTG